MQSILATATSTTSPFCAACNRQFRTLSGFHSHLRQRRNDDRCRAMYCDYLARLEAISESESESISDADSEPDPVQCQADSMDVDLVRLEILPMEYDDEARPVEYDDDEGVMEDDTAEVFIEGTDGWPEPEREGAPIEHPTLDNDNDNPLETENISDYRRQAEHVLIDTGDGPKPLITIRYTEKHRHSRAGSVVNHSDTHDDQYASAINYSTNTWAPFSCKLDWELARWAKMRGPGSTALSELLAIEGVSHFDSNYSVHCTDCRHMS